MKTAEKSAIITDFFSQTNIIIIFNFSQLPVSFKIQRETKIRATHFWHSIV